MKLKLTYDRVRDAFCLVGRMKNPGDGWDRVDGVWITRNPVRAALWRRYAGRVSYGMLEKVFGRFWTYYAADGMSQRDLVRARSVRPAEYEDWDSVGQLWWRIREAKFYKGDGDRPEPGPVERAGEKIKEPV